MPAVPAALVAWICARSDGENEYTAAQWMVFVLSATGTVLGLLSDSFYGSGGTANFTTVGLTIQDSTRTVVLQQGGSAYCGSTVAAGVSNAGIHVTATLDAGTYYLVEQYGMQGGAVTTFNDLKTKMDVYLMGYATSTPVTAT